MLPRYVPGFGDLLLVLAIAVWIRAAVRPTAEPVPSRFAQLLVVILVGGLAYAALFALVRLAAPDIQVLPSVSGALRLATIWLVTYNVLAAAYPDAIGLNRLFIALGVWQAHLAWQTLVQVWSAPSSVSVLLSWALVRRGSDSGPRLYYDLGQLPLTLVAVLICYSILRWDRALAFARQRYSTPGPVMQQTACNTTRLLCAAAILNGPRYRRAILDFLTQPARANAPEIGLDARLVAQICVHEEERHLRQAYCYVLIGLMSLILAVLADLTVASLFLVGLSAILWATTYHSARTNRAPLFQRGRFDPEHVRASFPSVLGAELASGIPDPDQNLIVFKGFNPFVGCGVPIGGWSFAIDVLKAKDSLVPVEPIGFTNDELYAEIERALRRLQIPSLEIRDLFFVSGADVREDRDLLPDEYGKPASRLESRHALAYINQSDTRVRHYKCVRAIDWGSDLAVSNYIRCALRGPTLFVELKRFLLPPLAENYRTIDSEPHASFRRLCSIVVGAPFVGPLMLCAAPFRVYDRLATVVKELLNSDSRRRRSEIDEQPLYDYGASTSLRELYSSKTFGHYFQKTDADFYKKVLERQLLDAICTFLDEHHVDTRDLRDRQSTIMNSGIIVQGGDVLAETLSVGTGAQAKKTVRTQSLTMV